MTPARVIHKFNLHRLGATVKTFHVDYFAELVEALNLTRLSDRLVTEWCLGAAENETLSRPRSRAELITMVSAEGTRSQWTGALSFG